MNWQRTAHAIAILDDVEATLRSKEKVLMADAATEAAEKALKAKIERQKAEEELAEWQSAASREQRLAQTRAATAKAEQDAQASKTAVLKSLVPDLAGVERGEVKIGEGPALFGSALGSHATEEAATRIAKEIKNRTGGNYRILVTTDSDLAASDAVYADLLRAATQLNRTADAVLKPKNDPARWEFSANIVGFMGAASVVSAAAAAIPSVLSLLSAHRSVSSQPVTADDAVAAIAVAGALAEADPQATVIHDDFRTLSNGPLVGLLDELSENRYRLLRRKAALDKVTDHSPTPEKDTDPGRDVVVVVVDRSDDAVEDTSDTLPSDPIVVVDEDSVINTDLLQGIEPDEGSAPLDTSLEEELAVVNALITAIDTFSSAISTAPGEGRRSPLVTAMLREKLHAGAGILSYVLLVKGCTGATQQVIDDRPLLFDDRFTTVATAGISYLLVGAESGRVYCGGTKTVSKSLSGRVGSEFLLGSVRGV